MHAHSSQSHFCRVVSRGWGFNGGVALPLHFDSFEAICATVSIKRMSTNCAGLIDNLLQAVRELCNPRRDMAVASAQLHRALDSQEELDGSAEEVQPLQSSLAENSDSAQASQDYFAEHMARLKAEGEAQHASRRLAVAQEQLAEYAAQKEMDADALLQQAQQLEALMQNTLQAAGQASGSEELQLAASELRKQMADAAGEARNFAVQQRADVERSKRTFEQADLPQENASVDQKRMREDLEGNHMGNSVSEGDAEEEMAYTDDVSAEPTAANDHGRGGDFTERAQYIPLRLQMPERRLLRLVEAALSVSEYTDKVDVLSWNSKTGRIHAQIKDICAILCGLVVAQDYKKGQKLMQDRNFQDHAEFYQDCFECARRWKVMNPDRLRSEYGKLVYMLMDSTDAQIQGLLEFRCVRPLRTVYTMLEELGGLQMLEDSLMEVATAEIVAGDRPRYEIQRDIKRKERAREMLCKRYKSRTLKEDDILLCLYSISDNNSFLLFNRDPIDKMIACLEHYFDPARPEPEYSLGISGGCDGARLTHSHERQYNYALQSLTLWREISHDMFKLWCLAEGDLLRESNSYRLQNTGQGLQRVQQAPAISKAMHSLLWRCQQRIGHWVGSSVIHLGDHNVPNALMFIDKYTQVPRILAPLVIVVEQLPTLCRDPHLMRYVTDTFGGVEECRKQILQDFFRHAFDGSGADSFFDAGSCIDGRLTSAWNWCSKIEKKPYWHVFQCCGFHSFDGDFQK